MHAMRCAKQKRCATCQQLLGPGDEARHFHCPVAGCGVAGALLASAEEAARHAEVFHGAFPCEDCGAEGMAVGARYEGHLAHACPKRLVACAFCGERRFRAEKLEEHAGGCGAKTDTCRACKQNVRRRDMAAHVASGCATGRTVSPPRGGGAAHAAPAAAGVAGGGDGVSEEEVQQVAELGASMLMAWTPAGIRGALRYNALRGVTSRAQRVQSAVGWLIEHPA
jgi:hypothetical protein